MGASEEQPENRTGEAEKTGGEGGRASGMCVSSSLCVGGEGLEVGERARWTENHREEVKEQGRSGEGVSSPNSFCSCLGTTHLHVSGQSLGQNYVLCPS